MELGFDEADLKTKQIAHVRPDSAAFEAGLRDGMKLTGYSIYWDNPEREVRIGVLTDAGKQSFRYKPVAKEPVTVPQYHAADDATDCKPF